MILTMRQISNQNLNKRHTHVGIPIISITSDVLGSLRYDSGINRVLFDSLKIITSYVI